MNKEKLLNDYISTMRETSYDSDNKEYMSLSDIEVIDFDNVKGEYVSKKYWPDSQKPIDHIRSCDTFYISDDDKFYLIEFKNGKISRKKQYQIYEKIYDSFIILLDVFNMTVSDWRIKTEFILVYNSKNNKEDNEPENIQDSKSRAEIGNFISSKADENFIRFGLGKYQDYLFNKVFTLTEEEFEEEYVNYWEKELGS